MNPAGEASLPPPLLQAPPPPQPHRSSTSSCASHPDEHFTGFCPSCLCERLAVLDHTASAAASSSSRKPPASTAAAAFKAIFKPTSTAAGAVPSFFPELRRTKSFSASKNSGEGYFSGAFEPQRKSCDVRGRSTLWNLFSQDDERKHAPPPPPQAAAVIADFVESGRPSVSLSSGVPEPVIEDNDEVEEEEEEEEEECDRARVSNVSNSEERVQFQAGEIVEERGEAEECFNEAEELFELKPMKDHLDLDSQTKRRDLKEIAGSFWSAASVFSKKLQKWRQKQKLKKRRNEGGASATLPVEKPIGRQFRETQSEIADYGFGRRSCDTDPRFSLDAGRMSLDAGRMSFDDPRYSFDEPRASWDGYLIGRSFPRVPLQTMLSVVEDAPAVHVSRSDAHIPVEEPINEEAEPELEPEPEPEREPDHEPWSGNADDLIPGGSVQTREYYCDSASRRPRKSLDRSNSIRKTAQAVVAEIDEMKSAAASNARVTPAATLDFMNHSNNSNSNSNSNSLRDEYSEMNGNPNPGKKSRRWTWNIWGLIHRRSGNGDDHQDGGSRPPNTVERSYSETYGDRTGEFRNGGGFGFTPKVVRSNSSVSWRSASVRRSNAETNGHSGRKSKKEEPPPPPPQPFVLERNRSARYSPNRVENGLLRFYLTPMRNSVGRGGRSMVANGKGRYNHAHSIARSVLRLY